MKNFIDCVLQQVAAMAKGAAVFSAGMASCGGMYEPKRPEGINFKGEYKL